MKKKIEIWKDIPGYENYYQVSNLGNVKSIDRFIVGTDGVRQNFKSINLKSSLSSTGYKIVGLSKKRKHETCTVHKLVAMSFLGFKYKNHDLIVDHIDGDILNNSLDNLQLISQRENCIKSKRLNKSSKYRGVYYEKDRSKWKACIYFDGKRLTIGRFDNEEDAAKAYRVKLDEVLETIGIKKPVFKLKDTWMYEGDEHWLLDKTYNWTLTKHTTEEKHRNVCIDETFELFLTKQEALEYILKEAKERFKGCKQILYCGKTAIFNGRLEISDNTIEDKNGFNIWTENEGWIAEPIKQDKAEIEANKLGFYVGDTVYLVDEKRIIKSFELNEDWPVVTERLRAWFDTNTWEPIVYLSKQPKLMLGNEEVEVVPVNKAIGLTMYEVHCVGESVTKEEWINFYHSIKECWNWAREATLQLGAFQAFFSRDDDSIHFGCVDGIPNVTLDQIEAITKALNEL